MEDLGCEVPWLDGGSGNVWVREGEVEGEGRWVLCRGAAALRVQLRRTGPFGSGIITGERT